MVWSRACSSCRRSRSASRPTTSERRLAYALRGRTVVERGWLRPDELDDGLERDAYDERALHVLGLDDDEIVCTGRVVLPPGLPTEDDCDLVVEPRGEVVDVGRMCVAASHQSREHAVFVGLMCALYAQMRRTATRWPAA